MDNHADVDPPYRPWGIVTSEFWHSGQPERPAPDVHARISHVRELLTAGRPGDAAALAEQLDQEYTAAYGPAHQITIEVREVRGYLVSLTGDHPTALSWYLHAARLRAAAQGPEHPETGQATLRAYSLWHTIPAPLAYRLGLELLATVVDIHGADSDIAHRTRARLAALGETPAIAR
ncbi:hypothetical protein [Streptomyces niveus]|uniref:hypothetical protein n=1 Tax=Streptomyces niveus TaxID=193462 RepID=UPI003425941A